MSESNPNQSIQLDKQRVSVALPVYIATALFLCGGTWSVATLLNKLEANANTRATEAALVSVQMERLQKTQDQVANEQIKVASDLKAFVAGELKATDARIDARLATMVSELWRTRDMRSYNRAMERENKPDLIVPDVDEIRSRP